MKTPFFSVVIPTYNRKRLLTLCLNCLHPEVQSLSFERYEVIVTDDSNSEELKEFLGKEYPWVIFTFGPRRGPAANRNNGARYASGEWLIFTDDDCLPHLDFLLSFDKAVALYKGKNVLEGKTVSDRNKKRFNEEAPVNIKGGKLWSCNFAVSYDFFRKIGGFCESFKFPHMEDIEFHVRVKSSGQVIPFISDAIVCHPWRKSSDLKRCIEKIDSVELFLLMYPEQKIHYTLLIRTKIWLAKTMANLEEIPRYGFRGLGYIVAKRCIDFYALLRIGIKIKLGKL